VGLGVSVWYLWMGIAVLYFEENRFGAPRISDMKLKNLL
jgi:hypothetical protein